jgi:hypothetical protein
MYSDQPNEFYGQSGAYGQDGQYYYYPNAGSPYGGQGGQQQQQFGNARQQQPPPPNQNYYQPNMGMGNFDPIMTNIAKQYGETLVWEGTEMVNQRLQKFISVSRLKYYFAVDTAYVTKKMGLLFFPFTHKDWSIRFDRNEDDSVQPRNEVNAPDLYIPLMALITFVLVAGLSLGLQQKFTPEMLGMQASSVLGWLILEIMIFTGCTYVIQTDLKVFDLLAFCSYKFVGMIFVLVACAILSKTGYYAALLYFSLSLSVFLIRTLKVQIYSVTTHEHVTSGNKRRLYFLLTLAGVQPLLIWWLTYHLTMW